MYAGWLNSQRQPAENAQQVFSGTTCALSRYASYVHVFFYYEEVQAMKIKFASWLVAVSIAFVLPLCANAATYSFSLTGSQEVPPAASPAAGSALITINGDDTITFGVFALGLVGSPTAAHIHSGAAGVNGLPVFDLFAPPGTGPLTFPPFTLAFGAGALSPGLGALINAAPWKYYVNIHTSAFLGGEVRGQFAPVPVPAAVWLLGSALGGLGLVRRRAA